ncbi:hypothetical protein DFH06DRAFT_85977 [Mycena polygramma]|nr:hypothetical protein DFH06DRAFT_85977 [Mycena polygramma]
MRFLSLIVVALPASVLAAPFEKSLQPVDVQSLETQSIDIKATRTAGTRVVLQDSGVALTLLEDDDTKGNGALGTSVIQQLSVVAPHSNTPTISVTASPSRRRADARTPTVLGATPLARALPVETTVTVALHPPPLLPVLVPATTVEPVDANSTSTSATDNTSRAQQLSGVAARATSVPVVPALMEPIDVNGTDSTTMAQQLSRFAAYTTSTSFAPAQADPVDANNTTGNATDGTTLSDVLHHATQPSAPAPVDTPTRTTPSIGAPSHVFVTLLHTSPVPPLNTTTSSATTPTAGFLFVDTGDALSQRDIVAMAVAFGVCCTLIFPSSRI